MAATALADGHTLSGTVFGGGTPLPNTTVEALANGTTTAVATATTGADGKYALTLTDATYDLRVTPPPNSGFNQETIQDIVIAGADRIYDVVLVAPVGLVRISGVIRGRNNTPVANVWVSANDQYGQSRSVKSGTDGAYSIAVAPGSVYMNIYPEMLMPDDPNYSVPTLTPRYWSMYGYKTITGNTTFDVNLNVISVSGVVANASGSPIANASVSAGESQYVDGLNLNANGYQTTGTDGAYSMLMLAGSVQFTVQPPSGTTYKPLNQTYTLSADVTQNLTLEELVRVTLSGVIRGRNNTPVGNVWVSANDQYGQSRSVKSGTDGAYSIAVAPGSVYMNIYPEMLMPDDPNYSVPTLTPRYWSMYGYKTITGNTTFDVNLDVVSVTGVTTDSNGAGVPGVSISANQSQYVDGLNLNANGYQTTGADGAYSMLLLRTTAQFGITPPTGSGFRPVNLSPQLTGDLTQRVILQQADLAPPQIVSGPLVVHLSDTSVSISWTTNEAATSKVEYGIGTLSNVINDLTLGTNHAVTLLGLHELSTYQFRVSSLDGAGNGPAVSEIGTFQTQGAPGDITPPRITDGPTVSSVDQSSAIVQWTTDEPATGVVSYGLTSSLGNSVSSQAGSFTQPHAIRLTGLSAEATYYVQVTSVDPDTNVTSSSVFTFTTLAVPDTTPPVIIVGPTVTSTTDTKITVTWMTSEPSTSGVSYNDGTAYGVITDPALSTTHTITLSGLRPSTQYSIQVASVDAAGNGPIVSDRITATTEATPDTTAPVISNIIVSGITETSAVITWSTDELANSIVNYGATPALPDSVAADTANAISHHIELTGLSAGVRYYFTVKSTDPSGNAAASAELNFITARTVADQPPSAPAPVTGPAITRQQSFVIGWGASTDDLGLARYEVLRNGQVVSQPPPTITSQTETGLSEGTYQYQIRAVDTAGQTATSDTITVVVDRTPPQIATANVTMEATGVTTTVTYSATATDTHDAHPTLSCAPASGSAFPLGDTPVLCTATDVAGNQGNASFTITVKDTTAPSIIVPESVTTEATSGNGAVATYSSRAIDTVDSAPVIACSPASGSLFAVGITHVSCNAHDASGNASSKSFDVNVTDTTPPVVTVPADMVLEATGPHGAVATFQASAKDIVSGAVPAVCTPASGSTFAISAMNVTCTAVDAHNNRATASFHVLVRDTTPPVLTVSNMTLEATSSAGARGVFTIPVMDVVTPNIAAVCAPPSGTVFPIGTTTVACTATDAANNVGKASFTMTVRDTTPPVISSVTPSQKTLWPPNHQMIPMTVAVVDADLVDSAPVCHVSAITSNEVINGLGDGDTAPDWIIGSGLSFQLRAERAAKGPGRTYTIAVECSDASHNRSSATTTVSVPKDQK